MKKILMGIVFGSAVLLSGCESAEERGTRVIEEQLEKLNEDLISNDFTYIEDFRRWGTDNVRRTVTVRADTGKRGSTRDTGISHATWRFSERFVDSLEGNVVYYEGDFVLEVFVYLTKEGIHEADSSIRAHTAFSAYQERNSREESLDVEDDEVSRDAAIELLNTTLEFVVRTKEDFFAIVNNDEDRVCEEIHRVLNGTIAQLENMLERASVMYISNIETNVSRINNSMLDLTVDIATFRQDVANGTR